MAALRGTGIAKGRAGTRMADDMSNNNDAHRTYTDAITAQLAKG
jgi:hypothetical protein